jgi:hypothetical protein
MSDEPTYPAVNVIWATTQIIEGLCPNTGQRRKWSSERTRMTKDQMRRYGRSFLEIHMLPRMGWLFKVSQSAFLNSPDVPITDELDAPAGVWLPGGVALTQAYETLDEWHAKTTWGSGP